MGKEREGCGCWLRSLFAPVCRPPCQPENNWIPWSKCRLPALEPGISATCPFKPLLTFGLLWIKFLRRLFIPSSGFVVYAKGKDDGKPPDCETLVKAKDLPLYKDQKPKEKKNDDVNDNSVLVTTIRCMREELCDFMEQFEIVKQQVADVYLTGKAHTLSTIDYLREEDNTYPRIGAITAGALTGYLLALRKGRFKKLMYMGTGAGAMSAVIYPKEAGEYFDEANAYLRRYVIIAYHFINGDYSSGKPLKLGPVRKRKYEPNPLQQEYLDIQKSLEDDERCTCKVDCKDVEKPALPPKKIGFSFAP